MTGQGTTSGDTIDARASSGTLLLKVVCRFDDGLIVYGSAGADTVEITADGATAANLDDVTRVENIVIKDSTTAGTDAALTVYDGTVAGYGGPTSVNIDATELDGGISNFDEVFTLTGTGCSNAIKCYFWWRCRYILMVVLVMILLMVVPVLILLMVTLV